jgi:hypothetical protein
MAIRLNELVFIHFIRVPSFGEFFETPLEQICDGLHGFRFIRPVGHDFQDGTICGGHGNDLHHASAIKLVIVEFYKKLGFEFDRRLGDQSGRTRMDSGPVFYCYFGTRH